MSTQNHYLPFLAGLAKKLEPLALPVLRIAAGLIFIRHGYGKFDAAFFGDGLHDLAKGLIEPSGLPFPMVLAWLAMITEFVGGICLVLGLFTRLWAFLGAGMMILIILFVKGAITMSADITRLDLEVALAAMTAVIFIMGSGGLSLDGKMKKTF